MCTNLLFSSKSSDLVKSASVSSGLQNAANKSKTLQMLKPVTPNTTSGGSGGGGAGGLFYPAICSVIDYVYQDEASWPEIFIKAYVDDSLGERNWVDSPTCKSFVDRIKTAFATRPIPYSVENGSAVVHQQNNTNNNTTADVLLAIQFKENELQEIAPNNNNNNNNSNSGRKSASNLQPTAARYVREEVRPLVVELVKSYMSSSNVGAKGQLLQHQQQQLAKQRLLGSQTINSSTSPLMANSVDSRNFIKLLQNTCGIEEIRAIALGKLEGWLLNSKLESYAQDLLLAICLNCTQADQADREFIMQIIRIKPKLKQHQHYFDCIRRV
jgi:integrator complex subunit 1